MHIQIVTPARPGSRSGNRITANRWSRMLRQLGHRVTLKVESDGRSADLLVALHARRSAASIRRFHAAGPTRPIIVALTGTDLYRDLPGSRSAVRSLELATRLVTLQAHAASHLADRFRSKVRVIYQSSPAPSRSPQPLQRVFEVSVVGHLRPVKDPFRCALASRQLPEESRIRVIQIGAALSASMQQRAEREMRINRRYQWLGELPRWKAVRRLARSRLCVLSSRMEGGANVISEAVVAGIPLLASRISGSIGLLGDNYPGFFDYGSTRQLAELLVKAEQDDEYYEVLKARVRALQPLFEPSHELQSWRNLLAEF